VSEQHGMAEWTPPVLQVSVVVLLQAN